MENLIDIRKELWDRQQIRAEDIDYKIWENDRKRIIEFSRIYRGCMFVVDVFTCNYTFASASFSDLLGYEARKIETVEVQGDYLESRFHPGDYEQLSSLQVQLSHFIYGLPREERNDYKNIFEFRVLNSKGQYVRVTSQQQVLEKDSQGKAWLILGMMDISPDQSPLEYIGCTVLNVKTGKTFSPLLRSAVEKTNLTPREIEILRLMRIGLLSKEIAHHLSISIYTVNVHRQNIFHKLNVQNAIEAIHKADKIGLL